MQSSTELKARLAQLVDADYQLADEAQRWPLTEAMLAHLGDPDHELRDGLIYETLCAWGDHYTADELRALLAVLLDDQHLGDALGAADGDSVFTRSFALLAVVVVLDQHLERSVLTAAELRQVQAATTRALAEERDLRGWTGAHGWAHATAHAADVLGTLAQCPELGHDDLAALLAAIAGRLASAEAAFVAEEDERLAVALLEIAKRPELPQSELIGWLQEFTDTPLRGDQQVRVRHLNTKHFLRSVYFQLQAKQVAIELQPVVAATLAAISRFV